MLATVTEWGKKLPTSARYKMTHSFISILVYALIHTILQQELKPPLEGHTSNSGKPQDDQLLKCKSCSFHALSSRENIQLFHLYMYFNLFTTVRLSRKRSRGRCGECTGCQQPNCGTCPECLDMKCFGGPGVKKRACRSRKCTNFDTARATTATDTLSTTISTLSSQVHGSGKNVLLDTEISCAYMQCQLLQVVTISQNPRYYPEMAC